MYKIRLSTLYLLMCFAIFLNIERLDFGQENIINISSGVYVFGIVFIIFIVLLPKMIFKSMFFSLLTCIGVYLLCKLLIFNAHPLFGGVHTYISAAEIVLIAILAWTASRFSYDLDSFQKMVDDIGYSEMNKRVRPLEKCMVFVENEVVRSRRNKNYLSVVVVEPETTSIDANIEHIVQKIEKEIIIHKVFSRLTNFLCMVIRRTDLIMEQKEKNRIVILCPETPISQVDILLMRIKAVTKKANLPIIYGTATFPDEALTFEELLSRAVSRLENPSVPVVKEPKRDKKIC